MENKKTLDVESTQEVSKIELIEKALLINVSGGVDDADTCFTTGSSCSCWDSCTVFSKFYNNTISF